MNTTQRRLFLGIDSKDCAVWCIATGMYLPEAAYRRIEECLAELGTEPGDRLDDLIENSCERHVSACSVRTSTPDWLVMHDPVAKDANTFKTSDRVPGAV
jgi:hypothetical protein